MKAIICYGGPGRVVHITTFTRDWTSCQCGNVRAKWINEHAGTMVADAIDRDVVRFLGMDNRMLVPMMLGITPRDSNDKAAAARLYHEMCTSAPGYLFDKSRFGCWAVIAEIGSTRDTRWATPEESAGARAPDPPADDPVVTA